MSHTARESLGWSLHRQSFHSEVKNSHLRVRDGCRGVLGEVGCPAVGVTCCLTDSIETAIATILKRLLLEDEQIPQRHLMLTCFV